MPPHNFQQFHKFRTSGFGELLVKGPELRLYTMEGRISKRSMHASAHKIPRGLKPVWRPYHPKYVNKDEDILIIKTEDLFIIKRGTLFIGRLIKVIMNKPECLETST